MIEPGTSSRNPRSTCMTTGCFTWYIAMNLSHVQPCSIHQKWSMISRRNSRSINEITKLHFYVFVVWEIFYTQSFTIGLKRQQSIGVQHSPTGLELGILEACDWKTRRSMWISLWKQPRPGLELPGCTVDGNPVNSPVEVVSWNPFNY